MASFDVHDAGMQLSMLLDRVLEGETVLITWNGVPVAELVPAKRSRFPLGAGRNDPDVNFDALRADDWWSSMTDDDVDAFLDGG